MSKPRTRTTLLSIAGYDPSGGAGVLLDVRVFARLGHSGFGVLTAVTAQDAERVDRVFPVPAPVLTAQYDRLSARTAVAGIKIGMLGTAGNLAAVARILGANPGVPRIVDPVLRASSGTALLEEAAWPRLLSALRGKADLITPNLDEAEALAGFPVRTVSAMEKAAEAIGRAGRMACLIKGGHLRGKAVDVLYDGSAITAFSHARSAKDIHGTGCFLSAAVLAFLAEGECLAEACLLGIVSLRRAIRDALPAGRGRWVFGFTREKAPANHPRRSMR